MTADNSGNAKPTSAKTKLLMVHSAMSVGLNLMKQGIMRTKSEKRARAYAEWQESLKRLRKLNKRSKKMTDTQKLEALIKQNAVDKERIATEGERLQAELKGLKPKLKHGDYGFDNGEACPPKERLFLKKFQRNDVYACNYHGSTDGHTVHGSCEIVKLGNIFADLKMLSEPLKVFDVKGGYGQNGFFAYLEPTTDGMSATIQIRTDDGNYLRYTLDEAEEISNNLRRLIATAGMRNK